MRKNFLITIVLIAGLVGGTGIGFVLTVPSAEYQEGEADYWRGEYYDLEDDLQDLQDLYDNLLIENGLLEDQIDALIGERNSLLAILDAYENPLTSPVIPTINQVANWLATDDTDSFDYDDDPDVWLCGDFAAMLMVNAKLMNWRMRVACMFWSELGDAGWQVPTDAYGEYGHAFNVILCQDYNGDSVLDWFYIEPQTDTIWYVVVSSIPYVHYDYRLTFGGGISGTVWSEPYYINHYSYFA